MTQTDDEAPEHPENEPLPRKNPNGREKGRGFWAFILGSLLRRKKPKQAKDDLQESANDDLERTSGAIFSAAVVGLVGLGAYALASPETWDASFRVLGAGVLIAGAAFLVGTLLGFLFGIPRSLRQPGTAAVSKEGKPVEAPNDPQSGGAPRNENAVASSYSVNTNLEEISDWLTKILVGVGLTELREIPGALWNACGKFVVALGGTVGESGDTKGVQAVVAALVVHFMATGFLFGYLLTRLFLTGAFVRAESMGEARKALRRSQEALQQSQRAREEVGEAKTQLLESQAISLLYVQPPEGFRKVIALLEPVVKLRRDDMTGDLWVYLACAYGQSYKWAKEHGASEEELKEIRENGLRAVKAAAEKKPDVNKRWMESLMHPLEGSPDNDLASFAGDPDFERLLE